MEKEIKINGYRCKFLDNAEEPECEFLCIPIVHDVKYVKSWATIGFTPEEEKTFGKRVHIIGSRIMPTTVPGKVLSVFVFTYMENDDLEFIKRNVNFFFKECKLREETQTSESKKLALKLRLYNYGDSKIETIKIIKHRLNMRLGETKNSIDSISIMGCVDYDLSKLSKTEMQTLLAELRSNNVKFSTI